MEDVVAGLEVDAARRLVEEQEGRVGDQRPGEEDALLLAARQLADVAFGEPADPEALEQPVDARAGRRPSAQGRHGRPAHRPISTTSRTVAGKFQSTVSSCGTQPTPRRPPAADGPAVDGEPPRRDPRDHADDRAQQRRLARP